MKNWITLEGIYGEVRVESSSIQALVSEVTPDTYERYTKVLLKGGRSFDVKENVEWIGDALRDMEVSNKMNMSLRELNKIERSK